MQIPLQLAFRNMEPSTAIADEVRGRVDWLEEFCPNIVSCHVVVEVPHQHHRHGNQYKVRIGLIVPGEEITVSREPPEHAEHQDVSVAIRDTFDSARRRLEEYARQRRQQVKTHEETPHAWVTRLFPEQEYGFLRSADGREVYFHRHSVVNGVFDRLEVGTEVIFVEQEGSKGPQASTVRIAGRHNQA
jgi:cold shock CspA family protein/ribosome-associated translation inhibitor RaiA